MSNYFNVHADPTARISPKASILGDVTIGSETTIFGGAYIRGDMAPVLDVEPTDAAICRMGGKEALHREMAAWVRTVKEACGTLPVIYVSQSFVHKYFDGLPHEVAACPTWIARYSNYMPVIHMTHWQLSPRGRVAGIKGDVDINVFNGSKDDFHAFLSQTQVTSTYTPPKQSKPRARTGKTRRRR